MALRVKFWFFESSLLDSVVLLGHRDFEDLWDAQRREYFIDRHRATFEVLANWFMEEKFGKVTPSK